MINVLFILMQLAGPTPVAGTAGTTAAFFALFAPQHISPATAVHARAR